MKKSPTLSRAATEPAQTMPQDLHTPEEALRPSDAHHIADEAGTGNPSSDLTPQTKLDLLRGLPSFGFEMVGDEPQHEEAGCQAPWGHSWDNLADLLSEVYGPDPTDGNETREGQASYEEGI